MPNTLGWRMKFGVILPSTNTVLEPELESLRPDVVTNHFARMHLGNIPIHDPQGFNEMLRQMDQALEAAVDSIMTCEPDHLILAIWPSGESGGLEPVKRIRERILNRSKGIDVTQPADALSAALKAYAVQRRVAMITPFHPSVDKNIREFIEAVGYEVVRAKYMTAPQPTMIAKTTEDELRGALREVDGRDIEAIIQMGANLPMGRLAAEAERWMGKPVIAINVVSYWHALRRNGITDKIYGWGRLLAER